VPFKTRKLHQKNHFLNHSMWDKLGQWDPNTFSKIEAQTQRIWSDCLGVPLLASC
jgi:hypothetical protein